MTIENIKESIIISNSTPPANGASLMWNKGSASIVRAGKWLYVVVPEVNYNLKPLCYQRWVVYRKSNNQNSWERFAEGEYFNEREPFPAGLINRKLIISANPATTVRRHRPDDSTSWYSRPELVLINQAGGESEQWLPQWDHDYKFFDHSYRGMAIDEGSSAVFLTQQAPYGTNPQEPEYGQAWSYLDKKGATLNSGLLSFPHRGCYPLLATDNRMAAALFDSDIVEPNAEFKKLKKELTGRDWDYVFQNIYLYYSDDIIDKGFADLMTIDSCSTTAGDIRAHDLWLTPDGTCYILYRKVSTQWPFIRDKFSPDKPIVISLELAIIKAGKIIARQTILKADDQLKPWIEYGYDKTTLFNPDIWTNSPQPITGRFWSPDNEQLFVIWSQKGQNDADCGIYIQTIKATSENSLKIPLKTPLMKFSLPAPRNGSRNSAKIAIYGTERTTGDDWTARCAEFEIKI